ncbi:uncharacterized protein LOC123313989 [Coccinella septempunctata]|uniref:uncharacterized protein LOC123313989 n=1 Tax=Coccinella septempunctata TaxID=41139 RepID=UPI001D0998FE|nr:uncharacterized protein LOC123313989 [Coccinella septempunctata]
MYGVAAHTLRQLIALISSNEASEHAPSVGTALGGRSDRSLADEGGASGARLRNGSTRPSNPINDNQSESLGAPEQGGPALTLRRGRQHWSREMNLYLMNAYFQVTEGETKKDRYRDKLEEQWRVKYPTLNFTTQHLAAQISNIKRNRLISPDELEEIKLHYTRTSNSRRLTAIRRSINTRNSIPHPEASQEDTEQQELKEEIKASFRELDFQYKGTAMYTRPMISRIRLFKEVRDTVEVVNSTLATEFECSEDLEDLCHKIYCAATLISSIYCKKTPSEPKMHEGKPPWETRLEAKITSFRKEIGVLENYLNGGTLSKKAEKKAKAYARKAKIIISETPNKQDLKKHVEILKQKIAALGNRLLRYHKRILRFQQNRLFSTNQRLFYRNIGSDKETPKQPPTEQQMTEFWSNIWSQEVQHNSQAYWINTEKESFENRTQMPDVSITRGDIAETVKRLRNWTAPGVDGICNYWWKAMSTAHNQLALHLQEIIQNPEKAPKYFTMGITYMLPKKGDLTQPQNYRPITCLPSVYKILTSVIGFKISTHIRNNRILAWEQNGCKKKARGCKELLVIDNVVTKQARRRLKNISMCWIDYQKAYDSVPHSWLVEILRIYKISPDIIHLWEHLMGTWRTTLSVKGTKSYRTKEISIKRGIFQGDNWSTEWFCPALNPLSNILNRSNYGYRIDDYAKLTHLFYVDDLKLYARGTAQLQGELELVRNFSADIKMKFGLEKCSVVHVKRGKMAEEGDMELINGTSIRSLGLENTYKYLGIQQSFEIRQKRSMEVAEEEFKKRINKVLKTELNAKNKITAINMWAIPVLTYTSGILTCLEAATEKEIKSLGNYFLSSNLPVHKRVVLWDKKYTALNLASPAEPETDVDPLENMRERWRSKVLHGRFHASINQPEVDKTRSHTYLVAGYLYASTEAALHAIQDQVVPTRNYSKYIMKQQVENTKCRICNQVEETVQHLSGGCTPLASTKYLGRHNNMGKVVHQLLGLRWGLIGNFTPQYKYTPVAVAENEQAKIFWDFPFVTDRALEHNRPDLVLWMKREGISVIEDFSVPLDHNIAQAYDSKIVKYTELARELKTLWKLERQVRILPLVISGNGLVHVNTTKHLAELQLPDNTLQWMQKAVVLGTVAIIRQIVFPQ